MRPDRRRQGGFAIFTALFVLVFMALLSAGIATTLTSAQSAASLDLEAVQAQLAARAGIEWGLSKAWNANGAGMCSTAGQTNAFAAPLYGGMAVTVRCKSSLVAEAGDPRTHYALTAWACNQPNPDTGYCPGNDDQIAGGHYVERKSFAVLEK